MRRPMPRLALFATAAIGAAAPSGAGAYEYRLPYTPPGNFEKLVVAGYTIANRIVTGNCSYTQITSGSGRDPPTHYIPMPQTCTWNATGALLSTTAGAPAIPPVIGTIGTQTIYARATSRFYTGTDSAYGGLGFVFTYGAHDSWQTSNAYLVLPQKPYSFTIVLASDGDVPLRVTRVAASTAIAATPDTPATRMVVKANSCVGLIAVGSTCSITLTYSDAGLTSPSGLAYDTLTVHLVTNAALPTDFVQHVTDEVKVPVDGGG